MEQREWLLRATEGSSIKSMWGLLIYSNSTRHCACFVIVWHMISCSVEGRQSEKRGTSFIIRLVVHLKALICRALWRRVMAALSCSLATLTWTACTIWCLGCAKGVVGGLLQWEGGGLGDFGVIPDVLELEAKSYGGTIWVELMQDGLQEFGEAAKVHVFMGVEQPANFGDEGGLDRMV